MILILAAFFIGISLGAILSVFIMIKRVDWMPGIEDVETGEKQVK